MPPVVAIKFTPHPIVRRRLEKIAEYHGIGHNDASANELMKQWASPISLIKPAKLYEAMAALKPYQVTNPFAGLTQYRPNRTKQTL
ncbi:MAG: hypothetical protein WC054_06960 [Candidatus Nanopelagicales bacterium]